MFARLAESLLLTNGRATDRRTIAEQVEGQGEAIRKKSEAERKIASIREYRISRAEPDSNGPGWSCPS
jgi:hypothetical protein